ncbi:MAG: quinolinate synthase NadA [Mailhella sp.]|nr:quinolinate synthase NadA [Mailhella sp.]
MDNCAAQGGVAARIEALRQKYGKDLAILAHHYQGDDVVAHVDFTGDSLELARKIPEIDAKYIVFCGVFFMAESAALLARSGQKVFLPAMDADCTMARMATAADVESVITRLQAEGRKVMPLAYVNSSLEVKAVVGRFGGSVCTSSNAARMMRWALENGDVVLFLPDRNLGRNICRSFGMADEEMHDLQRGFKSIGSEEANRAKVLFWPGCCPTHAELMKTSMVDDFHAAFPGCRVLVHPECSPAVVERADGWGSTAFLINEAVKAAEEGREKAMCIGTEFHLVHRLMDRLAGKINIIPLAQAVCRNMTKVTAENLLETLEKMENGMQDVTVPEELKAPAKESLVRMLDVCRK